MKKNLSIVITLTLIFSLLCTTTMSVFALFTETRGLGIVDGTNYYIYVGNNDSFDDNHFLTIGSGLNIDEVITRSGVSQFDWSYVWRVDEQSDGTFKLTNYERSGYNLSIEENPNVITSTSDHDDFVNFEICRIDNDIYQSLFDDVADESVKGKYIIKNDINYLTMGTSGVEVTTTPTAFSCWSFVDANKGFVDYYGYQFSGDSIVYDIVESFENMGYTYIEPSSNTPSYILENMTYNDITIITGLGQAGTIIVNPDSTGMQGQICADYHLSGNGIRSYVCDLPENSLAGSSCIIYLSPFSGYTAIGNDNEPYNLVEETYKKGAHYVLGFTRQLNEEEIRVWLNAFIAEIETETTINSAVAEANKLAFEIEANVDPLSDDFVYFCGDGTQTLAFSDYLPN